MMGKLSSVGVAEAREQARLDAHALAFDVHRGRLRDEFPRIGHLLDTMVRVHGACEPRLRQVQTVFADVRAELEPHLDREESELFPAWLASEQFGRPVDEENDVLPRSVWHGGESGTRRNR